MKIIPAIDIINGKCVRLEKGAFSKKKEYAADPLEMAKIFDDNGLKYLHLVDLDGAKSGTPKNFNILEKISANCDLDIDFSGGLSSTDIIQKAFDYGARKVTIGSMAFKKPNAFIAILEKYGSDKIILAADANSRKLSISAWLQEVDVDVIDFINEQNKNGVREVMCTSISHDGVFTGPDINLYSAILDSVKIDLIASGGIRSKKDLIQLKKVGCSGAIVGKAIYENRIDLKEISGL